MSRLFGRAPECAALDAAVAAARRGRGESLVVTGGPGAGKSELLDYVATSAGEAGIIRIEGLEAEAGIGLAGLHRLLLFHPNGRGVLPPAQRRALDASLGADGSADGGYAEASPFLLGLAVLTLLGDLSGSRLLVCLIDDAHWLDAESAQVLAFVARRLRNERIFMLFAAREDEPAGDVFAGIPDLPVPPLGLDDAVELLLATAGGIPLDRRVARQIAVRAEGNPLAITEVGRELAARRTPPHVLLDEPLPVGSRLRRHYEASIRGVPEDTRQLLLLAAVNMGSPGTLWRAAELAGLKESAAAPAEEANLITLEPGLRFRHPLIRSAAYDSAPEQARRQAHCVLAAAARAVGDRQAAAWHLAAATDAPEEAVATELEAAAQSAHDRGSLLNESAFLARAAELSPDSRQATRRRLRAAEAALLGGAPLRAESLTGQLPPDAPCADRARADHLRVQARLAAGRGVAEAPSLLLDAALSCLKEAPALAREILLEAVTATFSASQLLTSITPAELGDRILTALGDDPVEPAPEDLLLTGLATLLSGRYLTAAPLLREAIAALAAAPAPRERVPVWLLAATFAATAIWEDRFALEWLARCEDLARRTGAMRPLTLCLIGASISNAARGQLALADQQTDEGRELGRALGWTASQLASFSAVRILAFRGDRKALRRAFADGRSIAAGRGIGDMVRVGFAAEITLRLGYGEYPEAYEAATAMRRQDAIGLTAEALPAIVEAGLRSGHAAEAAAALTELERYATASGTGWAQGLLARSAALLAPPEEAAPYYRKAIDLLARTTATADLARAHLLYGEWLRRHQHPADARPHLEKALGLFTTMGATPFAERARTELEAAGATTAAPQPHNPALTAREHQIAALAAAGYTNQEIANRLFITANTVEYHLKKVFRKLGVESRRQLRDKFG